MKTVWYWPRFDMILEWSEIGHFFYFEADGIEAQFSEVRDWSAFVKLGDL